jgi:hypothetical protein
VMELDPSSGWIADRRILPVEEREALEERERRPVD